MGAGLISEAAQLEVARQINGAVDVEELLDGVQRRLSALLVGKPQRCG